MREVLLQGECLLNVLDDAAYSQLVPEAFNGSVGGHYRHCLDHFGTLFASLGTGIVNYDARPRDARLETIRAAALDRTRELRGLAAGLCDLDLDRRIDAKSKVSYATDSSPSVSSTVGREVMFCTIHAIHHYALISMMCGLLRVELPAGFGMAPSTLQHRRVLADA
jgi:hypothetical protein